MKKFYSLLYIFIVCIIFGILTAGVVTIHVEHRQYFPSFLIRAIGYITVLFSIVAILPFISGLKSKHKTIGEFKKKLKITFHILSVSSIASLGVGFLSFLLDGLTVKILTNTGGSIVLIFTLLWLVMGPTLHDNMSNRFQIRNAEEKFGLERIDVLRVFIILILCMLVLVFIVGSP